MLLRLEEFEAMITLVQQERCNAIGITGSLSETIDNKKELLELCGRIDAVEKLIEHVKNNISILEKKVEVAEAQFGITDNTMKLKNFFMPLFKKNIQDAKLNMNTEEEPFKTEDYFVSDAFENEQNEST